MIVAIVTVFVAGAAAVVAAANRGPEPVPAVVRTKRARRAD